MNQIWYGVSHVYLESKTERTFGIACLEKKLFLNRKYRFFRLLFAYFIFKSIELLSGQGVVQSEPKPVWSISWVPRVSKQKEYLV